PPLRAVRMRTYSSPPDMPSGITRPSDTRPTIHVAAPPWLSQCVDKWLGPASAYWLGTRAATGTGFDDFFTMPVFGTLVSKTGGGSTSSGAPPSWQRPEPMFTRRQPRTGALPGSTSRRTWRLLFGLAASGSSGGSVGRS